METEQFEKTIDDALTKSRLVLVVGPAGCGKSRLLRQLDGVSLINFNKELARELVAIPKEDRAEQVQEVMKELVLSFSRSVLALDNIDLLFLPELEVDPLPTLAELSQEKPLIVAWTGRWDGKELEWQEQAHPEHQVFALEECPGVIVSVG